MKDTHGGFGGLFALVAVNSKFSIHNSKLSFTHRFSLITRHCLSPLIAHGLPVRVARRQALHCLYLPFSFDVLSEDQPLGVDIVPKYPQLGLGRGLCLHCP